MVPYVYLEKTTTCRKLDAMLCIDCNTLSLYMYMKEKIEESIIYKEKK